MEKRRMAGSFAFAVGVGVFVAAAASLGPPTPLAATTSHELNCSSDPCMYGICLEDGNSSYSCYCIDGYTGANCEVNWDDCWSSPCENGGTCNDAIAAYNCTCPEGFLGTNCEQRYSECATEPCLNNGICLDAEGFFLCHCPDGYSGDFCEIDASVCNETICKNAGLCLEGPGFAFSCRCPEGWTGALCEQDVDECIFSPCMNGGLCINVPSSYTCACLFGYTGKNCDKPVLSCDANPCENGAVCLLEDEQQVCYCVPDYHGALCELRYDDCESKFANCENGGSCIDGVDSFTCTCPPSYTGPTCSEYQPILAEETTQSRVASTASVTSRTTTGPSTPLAGEFSPSFSSTGTPTDPPVSSPVTTTKPGANLVAITTTTTTTTTTATEGAFATFSSVDDSDNTAGTLRSTFDVNSSTAPTPLASVPPSYSTEEYYTAGPIDLQPRTLTSLITTIATTTEGSTTTAGLTEPTASSSTSYLQSTGGTVSAIETTLTTPHGRAWAEVGEEEGREVLRNASTQGFDEFTLSTTESADTPTVSTGGETLSTNPADASSPTAVFELTSNETPEDSFTSTPSTPSHRECDCTPQEENKCRPEEPEEPEMRRAAFNGKSYGRYRVDVLVLEERYASLVIRAKVRTRFNSGILLHLLFDEERYALLYLEAGSLKFHFSCGARTMLLGEIDARIDNGYEVDLETRFEFSTEGGNGKCSGKLLFNDSSVVSGQQALPRRGEGLPRQASLHLGGLPGAFSHDFPRPPVGFVGCIADLEVNGAPKHFLRDAIETFQLEKCTSFLCLPNPCANFGGCKETNGTVLCNCVAGYTGPRCERSACEENPCQLGASCIVSPAVGFLCVCPLGAHGLLCEEDTRISRPSFSVILPGLSAYVAYGLASSVGDGMELRMTLLPRTVEQISLIAYLGQSGSRRDITDHLSLSYVRGYIMLTWDLGSGVRRIFTSAPLTTAPSIRRYNPWIVRVGRRGRDAWLAVDGIGNVTGTAVGSMTSLDVAPILYIGGHKSQNFESLPHDLPLHSGFSGCIYDVELRTDKAVQLLGQSSPASGRGVAECHRNECVRHSCKNGAVCLSHGPTYSCICSKDWTGIDCSLPTRAKPSSAAGAVATAATPCTPTDD